MNSEERPSLGTILAPGELFVDLVVGIDLAFNDTILIKAKQDIGEALARLVAEYEAVIDEYEAAIDGACEADAFVDALARLTRLGNEA